MMLVAMFAHSHPSRVSWLWEWRNCLTDVGPPRTSFTTNISTLSCRTRKRTKHDLAENVERILHSWNELLVQEQDLYKNKFPISSTLWSHSYSYSQKNLFHFGPSLEFKNRFIPHVQIILEKDGLWHLLLKSTTISILVLYDNHLYKNNNHRIHLSKN